MEQQMEMDFMEEGLNTTNAKVDPVSGNEVPPGSMPEEVRDDVDAKLSQGEYVVPADVVRFFGVKFFEDLRSKAKMGLDKMDKTGRINGEEPEMEEDDFPFSDEELMFEDDEVTEMAAGGYVNPYQSPLMPQTQQMAQSSGKKNNKVNVKQPQFTTGMAAPYGPSSLTRTSASPLPAVGTPAAGMNPAGVTWKTYKDSMGNIITVPFSGDTPLVAIPPGYTPAEATQTTPEYYDPNDRGDHGTDKMPSAGGSTSGESRKPTPIEENPMRSRESLEEWADKRASGMMNMGTGLGAVAGTVLGGGLAMGLGGARKGDQIFDQATYNAAAQMAEYRGWTDLAESFREKASGYSTGLLGKALGPGTGTSSRYINDWEATSGSMADKGTTGNNTGSDSIRERTGTSGSTAGTTRSDSERDSVGGYSSPDMPSRESAGSRGVGSEVSERSSETYAGQVNAARESGSVSNSTAAGLSGQQSTNPGGFDNERGEWGSGPMAKGGLVSKPKGATRKSNNNKKTRKGLASK